MARSIIASTSAAAETSVRTNVAAPPAATIACVVAWPPSLLMSATTSRAPDPRCAAGYDRDLAFEFACHTTTFTAINMASDDVQG
jgi:hypothetical protein